MQFVKVLKTLLEFRKATKILVKTESRNYWKLFLVKEMLVDVFQFRINVLILQKLVWRLLIFCFVFLIVWSWIWSWPWKWCSPDWRVGWCASSSWSWWVWAGPGTVSFVTSVKSTAATTTSSAAATTERSTTTSAASSSSIAGFTSVFFDANVGNFSLEKNITNET